MSVVLFPSSLLEISNLCLRGMSLFPGEAVNAALSAGDGKGGITAWQSIASTKTVATRSWQITISGIKPCPSRPWGYSPKCCPSTMAGSSQRKVFRRSARKAPMLFWQLSGSLKFTATLSVTGNATPRAG